MLRPIALPRTLTLVLLLVDVGQAAMSQSPSPPTVAATPVLRDGSHDFDFLIGEWKAHVRRLPDRLVGSSRWVDYDGRSNHQKIFGTSANLEDFEVWNRSAGLHLKGQTLRLYSPQSRQWSIYLVDGDAGTLGLPPVIGGFNGNVGEFYDQELYEGRAILVRYRWTNVSSRSARMEQAFSADGGKAWETNWICELSR
jgi:hypothetical protein